jgi:hypothetical protein
MRGISVSRPVRLNLSRINSGSISQKYSFPFAPRNQSIQKSSREQQQKKKDVSSWVNMSCERGRQRGVKYLRTQIRTLFEITGSKGRREGRKGK